VTTDRLSSDTPPLAAAADRPAVANGNRPIPARVKRWIAWGPGSSAALSIACFVVILASVIGSQRSGASRSARPEAAQTAPDSARAEQQANAAIEPAGAASTAVAMPVAAKTTGAALPGPGPAVEATLARARACAAAERWNCVLDAANSVLAMQEGNTEAQSLLQRAIVNGGWASSTAATIAPTSNAADAQAAPVSRAHKPSRKQWRSASRE
jgi:hypothetical protein